MQKAGLVNRAQGAKRVILTLAGIFLAFAATPGLSGAQTMKNTLSEKQQAIIPIAAFTASGDLAALQNALNAGLDAGLTVNEIKEVLVQLYAYAGFPRSLNALGAFYDTLGERRRNGIKDPAGREASPLPTDKSSLELGTETQTSLVGAPVKGGLMDFAPAIDEYLKAHLFGDIFGRDNLDWQSREIATVAALSNITGAEGQLRSHLGISLNVGLTSDQLQELAAVLGEQVSEETGRKTTALLEEVLRAL